MKYFKKYWPVVLLGTACLALILLLVLMPGGTPVNTDQPYEEDPESVVVDDELSEAKSNLDSSFIETTDECEDTKTEDKTASSTSGNTNDHSDKTQDAEDNDSNDPADSSDGTDSPTTETDQEEVSPPPKNNILDVRYDDVSQDRDEFITIPKVIEVNGVPCAYEEETNTFIYSVSTRNVDVDVQYCMTGTHDGEELYFSFDGELIGSDGMYFATGNDTFDIAVFSDYEYKYCKLRFTTMPIMVLETENRKPLPNNDKNTNFLCTLTLQDPDADIRNGGKYLASYATVHLRGASSLAYPKKSLKVELQKFTTDENGNELMVERKKPLLGMRDDDDWVLDANYIDPTMMHNYLSYNLWKEIGGTTNPDAILAGPNCQYVEVILNGKYHGLYLLVEPVDEKQMGVQRSENTTDGSHGVYIKTNSWDGTKFDTISGLPKDSQNNKWKSTWMGFEIKYPESGIAESDWKPLYDLLNATAGLHNAVKNKDKQLPKYVDNFKQVALKHLSKENIVNYWILISVTLARDNAGKNIHWSIPNTSVENPKMYINAWDMDNSFGYRYGPTASGPVKDPVDTKNYADEWFVLLKYYIEYDVDGAKGYLKSRWAELTTGEGPCTTAALIAQADSTAYYLTQSGAFERERARWPKTSSFHASCPNPMETELEYMFTWIENRIPIVDGIVNRY